MVVSFIDGYGESFRSTRSKQSGSEPKSGSRISHGFSSSSAKADIVILYPCHDKKTHFIPHPNLSGARISPMEHPAKHRAKNAFAGWRLLPQPSGWYEYPQKQIPFFGITCFPGDPAKPRILPCPLLARWNSSVTVIKLQDFTI